MILTEEQLRDVPLAVIMVDMNEQERELAASLFAQRFSHDCYWIDINPREGDSAVGMSYWLTRLEQGKLEVWHGFYDSTVKPPYVLDFCEVYENSIRKIQEEQAHAQSRSEPHAADLGAG